MSEKQHDPAAGWGASGGDWWSRRPRRSATDRKIAGVAGGLGRALGVDPVLVRVGFVVLTIFGVGIALYLLSWLLLPADGDEVSAAESLLGRGRSSVPPVLTVGLAIIVAISLASMLSWGGFPFWPLIIVGIVGITMARKRARMGGCAGRAGWGPPSGDSSSRPAPQGQSWGEQAERWVSRQPWSGSGESGGSGRQQPASPFENPPFWEQDGSGRTTTTGSTAGRAGAASGEPPAADDGLTPRKPPAWDPLGVAPFAWDLPEPTPVPPVPPAHRASSVIGRVTMGLALVVGGLAAAGVFAGWWGLSWAAVSASALAVVAVGLLIGSLRGRGHALIGPGIFLSLVTLALTVTGIDGTSGYGQQTWAPTNPAAVQSQYVLNGGQGRLDLTQLTVPAGTPVAVDLEVRAGQASVIVPADANVNVTCSTNAGEVDCLGHTESGLHQEITATQTGSSDDGTINLNVHVGAGQAEVRHA